MGFFFFFFFGKRVSHSVNVNWDYISDILWLVKMRPHVKDRTDDSRITRLVARGEVAKWVGSTTLGSVSSRFVNMIMNAAAALVHTLQYSQVPGYHAPVQRKVDHPFGDPDPSPGE